MGESSAELNEDIMLKRNTNTSLRLCYQNFIATYLLENGYLDVATFFSQFACIPESIVIPTQYRISLEGSIVVTEIHCHN